MKINLFFLTLFFLIFLINICCVYRQEAYTIFDKFTLVDLFTVYSKQSYKKSCSLAEGPNCYQLSKYEEISDSQYLLQVLKKLKYNNKELSLDLVLKALNKELQLFKDKHKSLLNEVFKFSPKILMNLLLNFESFDQTTKIKDVYMPEEKIINFNVGYLKLNFKGKLRLTHDKDRIMKTSRNIDGPIATYGVIEDRDLFIKFDKPVVIKYLYIRPHFSTIENKYRNYEMNIVGYKNEKELFHSKMNLIPNNREWYKITPAQMLIDTLKLPKNFDVDDISISHDSDTSESNEDNSHLSTILQGVIDDLIEKNNKKPVNEDDI